VFLANMVKKAKQYQLSYLSSQPSNVIDEPSFAVLMGWLAVNLPASVAVIKTQKLPRQFKLNKHHFKKFLHLRKKEVENMDTSKIVTHVQCDAGLH